jgi:CBS domain-containing protein
MRISEVMTKSPSCCSSDTSLELVARAMVTCDCGSIPVTDGDRIVGMITDRDIVTRAVAAGKCPLTMTAGDLMSHPVAVLRVDDSVEDALKSLEENQVRRAPVVDGSGQVVGIVSQSDLALNSPSPLAGELVQSISKKMDIGHN